MPKSDLPELTHMLTANTATCFSNIGITISVSMPALLHGESISVKTSSEQVLCIRLFAEEVSIEIT